MACQSTNDNYSDPIENISIQSHQTDDSMLIFQFKDSKISYNYKGKSLDERRCQEILSTVQELDYRKFGQINFLDTAHYANYCLSIAKDSGSINISISGPSIRDKISSILGAPTENDVESIVKLPPFRSIVDIVDENEKLKRDLAQAEYLNKIYKGECGAIIRTEEVNGDKTTHETAFCTRNRVLH